jgi:putative DNA primase/helicase
MTINPTNFEVSTEASDQLIATIHRKHTRMAFRLAAAHGDELRYVHGLGWHVWQNGCWVPDRKKAAKTALLETKQNAMLEVARLTGQARDELYRDVTMLDTDNNINGTISVATALPPISTSVDELDPDPFLVNTPDGIYDLRTGKTTPHDRKQMHTKMAGCSTFGARKDGLWYQFIADVLPDPEVRRFAQKILGYAMLGRVQDQIFPIVYGESGTGKSTFLDSVTEAFGTYADIAPTTLLLSTGTKTQHPTEVAKLRGQRLVMVHETEKSQLLKSAAMKNMTGGDKLTGRFMREDFFTFTPSHTFVLVTNYPPVLDADDDAAWSRIRVIPFTQQFRGTANENTNLGHEILEQDLPSVLQWVLDGYKLYVEEGLKDVPAAVLEQTKAHNQQVDTFTEWASEDIVKAPGNRVLLSDVYEAWRDWAKPQGLQPGRKNDFQAKLERRGFQIVRIDRRNYVVDITLPTNESPMRIPGQGRIPQPRQQSDAGIRAASDEVNRR